MFNIPLVEKYRPNSLNDIVLNKCNRLIMNNILKSDKFPNVLLYGQPGTGKTTTIISLIKEYNRINNNNNFETIHLNASDDRGIENIRTIILNFAKTDSLFNNCYKFIILDEADYMTEHAQKCLKILMETNRNKVVFCLICNYITKIDISLANKFIKIYFKSLKREEIYNRLDYIIKKENIKCSSKIIQYVCSKWNNDIRSMINYIQMNRKILHKINLFERDKILEYLINNNVANSIKYINKQINSCCISEYEFLFNIIHYILNNFNDKIQKHNIDKFKLFIHNNDIVNKKYLFISFILEIQSIFKT